MQDSTAESGAPVFSIASLLSHFKAMIGPYGLYQHATKRVPNLREGYCTDDNTRAVQVLLSLLPHTAPAERWEIEQLIAPCWQFLCEAEETPGVYYNFRTAKGVWLTHGRSDDMYARLVRVLVAVLARDTDTERRTEAASMLARILARRSSLVAPRAWAEIMVALADLPVDARSHYNADAIIGEATERLLQLWQTASSNTWQWFEEILTYANALLPHGLLASLAMTERSVVEKALHSSAAFLLTATIPEGTFIPIGSNGWYKKGGQPSRDNQQPIEAGTMLDFLLDYEARFPGKVPTESIIAPYLWFFGQNTHGLLLVDAAHGASFDGLFPNGPNMNAGAESMLAYIWAEIRIQTAPDAIRSAALAAREKLISV